MEPDFPPRPSSSALPLTTGRVALNTSEPQAPWGVVCRPHPWRFYSVCLGGRVKISISSTVLVMQEPPELLLQEAGRTGEVAAWP